MTFGAAVSLIQIAVVVSGVVALSYVAMRLGLSRRRALLLGAMCFVIVLASDLLAIVPATRNGSAAAPGVPAAIDASWFESLRASKMPARGSLDEVRTLPPQPSPYDASRHLIVANASSRIVLRGWAIAASAGVPGAAVVAQVDGRVFGKADYGQSRPDVAAALGIDADARSGFTFVLDFAGYPRGPHTVVIDVITPDGTAYETLGLPIAVTLR
jgi:hypothetical protein